VYIIFLNAKFQSTITHKISATKYDVVILTVPTMTQKQWWPKTIREMKKFLLDMKDNKTVEESMLLSSTVCSLQYFHLLQIQQEVKENISRLY
jgi:hypothetical protein